MSLPVFTPFVMDTVPKDMLNSRSRKRREPMVAIPKRVIRINQQQEQHDHQQPSTSQINRPIVVKRVIVNSVKEVGAPRRPRTAIGNGQLLGVHQRSEASFTKALTHFPSQPTVRKYYSEDDLIESCYIPDEMGDEGLTHVVSQVELNANGEVCESDDQHVSVMTDGLEDDIHYPINDPGIQTERVLTLQTRRVQPSQLRQLQSENQYLKDQLDAANYRAKQLEIMLMDKNARVRDLVKESLQHSVEKRKIISHLGEDVYTQILKNDSRPKRDAARKETA